MSSISIAEGKRIYGGKTENETLINIAEKTKCYQLTSMPMIMATG